MGINQKSLRKRSRALRSSAVPKSIGGESGATTARLAGCGELEDELEGDAEAEEAEAEAEELDDEDI